MAQAETGMIGEKSGLAIGYETLTPLKEQRNTLLSHYLNRTATLVQKKNKV